MKSTTPCLCLLALLATGGKINADLIITNVARSGVIVESSVAYSTAFPVTGVIDGSVNEGTNAAPVSYWLTPNNVPKNAFFTLDLRGSYAIDSIVLYNTHNRQSYDRGTGPFVLYGAGAIEPRPPFSGQVDRYYSFDGDVNDHSTNGIQAIFLDAATNSIPPTFSSDVPAAVTGDSQSLSFSGAGEFLEFVDPLFPRQPTAYSISVWVKLPVPQNCSLIFRCTPVGEAAGYSHQLRVNANLHFEAYAFDNVGARIVTGTTVIQPDTWYHVVVTAQNSGFEHLYVNGVEEGTAISIGTLWTGGDRWRAGKASSGFAAMSGQLDELGIWLSTPLDAGVGEPFGQWRAARDGGQHGPGGHGLPVGQSPGSRFRDTHAGDYRAAGPSAANVYRLPTRHRALSAVLYPGRHLCQ
jgi:hypothetical protein